MKGSAEEPSAGAPLGVRAVGLQGYAGEGGCGRACAEAMAEEAMADVDENENDVHLLLVLLLV